MSNQELKDYISHYEICNNQIVIYYPFKLFKAKTINANKVNEENIKAKMKEQQELIENMKTERISKKSDTYILLIISTILFVMPVLIKIALLALFITKLKRIDNVTKEIKVKKNFYNLENQLNESLQVLANNCDNVVVNTNVKRLMQKKLDHKNIEVNDIASLKEEDLLSIISLKEKISPSVREEKTPSEEQNNILNNQFNNNVSLKPCKKNDIDSDIKIYHKKSL